MKKLAIVGLCVIGLLLPTPAGSQQMIGNDPDDTEGKLDISTISLIGTNDPDAERQRYTIVVETYEGWACSYLGPDRGPTKLTVKFNDRGDRRVDFVGEFYCYKRHLTFAMRTGDGVTFAPKRAKKPTRKSARVRIPESVFKRLPEMWARSLDGIAEGCDPCKDRAPDGKLRL